VIEPIATSSAGTQTSISQDSPTSSRSAMTMPPTHMIGAATSSVQVMTTSICTCCTSLVVRVISDGAPKRAISWAENVPTREKIDPRTSRPNAIDVRAPNQTAVTEQTIWTTVIPSIQPPVPRM
jgi:hypothetical protein